MVHGAPDFTKVMRGETDEVWIKGVEFRDPTVAACKPISVENPALAYELATDRFKVKIEDWVAGVLSADVSDRAARLLGIIYGDQGQLLQRPTTKDLLTQLRSAGVEIDPRAIRQLIASDVITAYGSQVQALLQRPTTYDLLAQLRHAGVEIDPRQIRALTGSDVVTVDDIRKVGSPACVQATASGNSYVVTAPGAGHKLRIKYVEVFNSGSANITVYLRFGAAGSARFRATLAANTGKNSNLVGCNWEGAENEALIVNLSAAGTVDVTVLYEDITI